MCGIVGAVGPASPERRAALDRAVTALHHRGPDGSGTWLGEFADLGHTRLAILDTSAAAAQPMVDPESGCVLVVNGEIYNFVELRRELEAKGHSFRSSGDSEVLLRSYLEWGEACLERLNGMFAFALADPRRQAVLIARDRFGEKPLHLARHNGSVWFASEVKALLAAGVVRPRSNERYLFGFLATGDLGHPTETAFADVDQLRAGHAGWIDPSGRLETWSWWEVPGAEAAAEARRDAGTGSLEHLGQLLDDAVAIRLRSDVPVGTSLSGGIDSTLVLSAVRARRPDGEIHAFTAGFPGSPLDELPTATATAARLGIQLHAVPLGAEDLVPAVDALHRAHETPTETPSVFAQYRVMQAAFDAGITVLLDGQGGDETWAGYPKYAAIALTDELVHGQLARAVRRERAWRATQGVTLRPAVSRYLGLIGGPPVRRALTTAFRFGPRWLSDSYRRRHWHFDPVDGVDLPAARFGSMAVDAQRRDLDRVMLPRLLRVADRNSMAWSREVRLPYLDHRLVELGLAWPLAGKLDGGWTKEPLRRLLDGRGATDVARKVGKLAFMPPTAQWLTHPDLEERGRSAWHRLHRAGFLASPDPVPSVLARWRVLSLVTWADVFGVPLP